jgi:hypothetical protein
MPNNSQIPILTPKLFMLFFLVTNVKCSSMELIRTEHNAIPSVWTLDQGILRLGWGRSSGHSVVFLSFFFA